MKKIIIITTLIITTAILAQKGKNSGDWSPYQGYMSWNDSKAKCASLGMRLPTIDELKMAREARVTESWKKDGDLYWTSVEVSGGDAFYFSIDSAISRNYNKTNIFPTRCIR